ncbi:hypothetical protein CGZ91_10435 [Parenemella sanctibonifatiensis]|uniref:Lactonase family protein n=2 Tax=Parenemella sanctibonifatiensis TaxID=2016505 RepID=A0A255EEB6_9ACTN|nr:hypothetical protein CGZ91_10435 [Parenemella sanctibonifatiensis]
MWFMVGRRTRYGKPPPRTAAERCKTGPAVESQRRIVGGGGQMATTRGSQLGPGTRVFVGGYTTESQPAGLHCLDWAEDGQDEVRFTETDPLPVPSASWLVAHPHHPILYALSETDETMITPIRIEDNGDLTALDPVATGSSGGCHMALSPDQRAIVVAHYTGGAVSSISVDPNGDLGAMVDLYAFPGSGTDPERQEASHPHQVVFREDKLYVPDLGLDKVHVMTLGFDRRLRTEHPVDLPAGAGPRHIAFLDKLMVVACELSAELWLGSEGLFGWREVERVPSTSLVDGPRCYPSALRIIGNEVFVGNRGPDTFAVFDLDTQADRLQLRVEVPTEGEWPRDIVHVGGMVWVANQNSDTISVFRRGDGSDPNRTWIHDFRLSTPQPACILIRRPR